MGSLWGEWIEEAVERLVKMNAFYNLRAIKLISKQESEQTYQFFNEINSWDRSTIEVSLSEETVSGWLQDSPSCGDEIIREGGTRKLLLFSNNDYLSLSSHPSVCNAASKAALEHGMGPKGSALVCGYTTYHRMLESSLADLKQKEECLLCPTGFSANMTLLGGIGSVASMLSATGKPSDDEKIAIFSDVLNHASIIDGLHLAEKKGHAQIYVYRHCDMNQLDSMLSNCRQKKKVVVTDSVFSMEGDIAPIKELVKLRKKHGFLFVLDDAHGSFIYGKNGGGIAEEYECEKDIDICLGTLSKAGASQGGFIACSKKWKLFIQSRGRSFMFSASMPVPLAAATHAIVALTRLETWRRKALWDRVKEFTALTGIHVTSPIISIVMGSEEKAFEASRYMLESGIHVVAIIPPAVPPNCCRLRITLNAAHTSEDVKKLVNALSMYSNLNGNITNEPELHAKL